jgi:ribosomal protein L40E
MEQKFCTKCGALLRENAKFCIKCGAPVTEVTEVKKEKTIQKESVDKQLDKQPSQGKTTTTVVKSDSSCSKSQPTGKSNNYAIKYPDKGKKTTDTSSTIIIALAILVAIIVIALAISDKNHSSSINKTKPFSLMETTQQIQKKPENINISAEDLMGAYNKDPQTAEKTYGGKALNVKSKVIWKGDFNNSDKTHTYCFTIYDWRYAGERYKVLVSVPQSQTNIIDNIQIGDNVIVTGKCAGIWKQEQETNHVVGIHATDIKKI